MKRVLIIAPNWIGDAVMAQPLFSLLKRFHPDVIIDAIAPKSVAPVLNMMPEIHQVFSVHLAHGKLQLLKRWQFSQKLKQNHYDTAYILPNSFKSALIPWLAGIPLRIGYKGEMRYGLLNVIHPNPSEKTMMMMHYAKLAYRPRAPIEHLKDKIPLPYLQITPSQISEANTKFSLDPQLPLLIFAPGAEYGEAKRWPAQHFLDLANLVNQSFPYMQIIALGSKKDREIADHISEKSSNVNNLCGKTTLTEASALIAQADAVVCNDSGLMHIAAALCRPIISIFGSSDPRHTPPLSPIAEILWLHLECSPCFERRCPLKHLNCLNNIRPEEVFLHLRKALLHSKI